MIAHHFTVDLEEFFQVSALESEVSRAEWWRFESRLAAPVAQLLDLLARYQARATFFVVGWVASRHADLIRTIARAGHEIASHSWDHARVTMQSPFQFRASIRRTKAELEDITGQPAVMRPGLNNPESALRTPQFLKPFGEPERQQLSEHFTDRHAGIKVAVPPRVVCLLCLVISMFWTVKGQFHEARKRQSSPFGNFAVEDVKQRVHGWNLARR